MKTNQQFREDILRNMEDVLDYLQTVVSASKEILLETMKTIAEMEDGFEKEKLIESAEQCEEILASATVLIKKLNSHMNILKKGNETKEEADAILDWLTKVKRILGRS